MNGQTVLVTGASSGIGHATAQLFAEHGAHVLLLARSPQKLELVRSELKGSSEALVCDITDPLQVKRVTTHLAAQGRRISALINNAGIFDRRRFSESSDELWQKHFEANVLGPARLTRECLPLLAENAVIVNVSSTLGVRPIVETSVYSAMKAATISWTQTLALELAPHGHRVCAVCPGLIDTPIHKGATQDPALRKQLDGLQPLGRIGAPREIAEGIFFLAQSKWSTGSVLTIDGGIQL